MTTSDTYYHEMQQGLGEVCVGQLIYEAQLLERSKTGPLSDGEGVGQFPQRDD